jgi:uncharacterized RDD family membrane protein YckC/cytoskeletal protein CcmA (bactofilin family)
MNATLLSHYFLTLALALAIPASTLLVQAQESSPDLRLEENGAPALKPGKKTRTSPPQRNRGEVVEIGSHVIVEANETVNQLVSVAGNATINGTVRSDAVIVLGSANVNGVVNGDLVTVLGNVTLGPEARVGGDVVVVGGSVITDPHARISGQQTVVALGAVMPNLAWLQTWVAKGVLLARPLPPQVQWVWVIAGLFLLIYLAMTFVFPRPVGACVTALEQQPVAAFFVGILLFILLGPLIFLLFVSVAGILAVPFVLCGVIAAALFGKVAIYCYTGQQIGRQFRGADISLPVALLIGTLLFYLIYMVPVLGFAAWGVATLIGLGAVLLAAFRSVRSEEEPAAIPACAAPSIASGYQHQAELQPAPAPAPGALPPPQIVLMPRVGFWRRLWATALDFVLLGILVPVTGRYFLILWAAYFIAMWTWKGTTIGGIVLSLKLVRVDGEPVNFAVALVRCLSGFFSAFALFIGFFWAGWDKEKQAWHDKIAGTAVVRVPKGISLI